MRYGWRFIIGMAAAAVLFGIHRAAKASRRIDFAEPGGWRSVSTTDPDVFGEGGRL